MGYVILCASRNRETRDETEIMCALGWDHTIGGIPSLWTPQPVSADIVHSDKSRFTSPVVSQADMTSLVDGNNIFAFNLYQSLRAVRETVFLPVQHLLAWP